MTLYKNGFNGELTTTELRENEEANRIFKVNTAESELINSTYIPGTKENHDVFLTASQVLNELTLKHQTVKLNHYNIGRAFRMLDFKQCQDRVDKPYSVKGYFLIWRKE